MTAGSEKLTRYIWQATLVERFDCVLFPIDVAALVDRLPELGWIVPRRVETSETVTLPEIPSKGNARLRLDTGNKTIGVTSNDLTDTLTIYRELRKFVRELSDFSPEVRTDYVELRYTGWMKDQSNPVEVLTTWWSGNERVSRLGRLLASRLALEAEPLAPYGLRFAPVGLDANRPNWAELTITPVNIAGNHRYSFDLIFRNEDSTVTEQVAESADFVLEQVLEELEKA